MAYTETMQTVILILGSALVTIFGRDHLGGWGQLRELCGSEIFNLWRPLTGTVYLDADRRAERG